MAATTRWWWIRHAPVANPDGLIYGQTDVPCDTLDRARLRALATILPAGALLVTSHLRRARETATALAAAGLGLPEALVEADLAEQHFGAWQGRRRAEVYRELAEKHPFWLAPAATAPPGGESFTSLVRRASRAILRLTARHPGRDIIAVAHGGTIRAAIGLALTLEPDSALCFSIDNLSLTRLDHIGAADGGHWRVMSVNRPAGDAGDQSIQSVP